MTYLKTIVVVSVLCLLFANYAYAYMYKLELIHQDAPSERSSFMLFEDGTAVSAKIYYKDGWKEDSSVKRMHIDKGKKYRLSELFSDEFFENSFDRGGISWMSITFESEYPPVSKKGYNKSYYSGPDAIVYRNGNPGEGRTTVTFLDE